VASSLTRLVATNNRNEIMMAEHFSGICEKWSLNRSWASCCSDEDSSSCRVDARCSQGGRVTKEMYFFMFYKCNTVLWLQSYYQHDY
jgi:hypothetical protein